ncbi:hypothetical protein CEXT_342101 [Caerostris extrusa]|uniref:Uncharacterized protein n=1 Tax=Caerostris extrusa TaxID=172846 RepID=A0AAV4X6G9_CAEEX|nr:hypothetical protein CEXT_342101 [Caerostris extrusa]
MEYPITDCGDGSQLEATRVRCVKSPVTLSFYFELEEDDYDSSKFHISCLRSFSSPRLWVRCAQGGSYPQKKGWTTANEYKSQAPRLSLSGRRCSQWQYIETSTGIFVDVDVGNRVHLRQCAPSTLGSGGDHRWWCTAPADFANVSISAESQYSSSFSETGNLFAFSGASSRGEETEKPNMILLFHGQC